MPKEVKGSIIVVVAYIVLFFATKLSEDASLSIIVPIEILLALGIYSIMGCLALVFVLPMILIVGERKKNKKDH